MRKPVIVTAWLAIAAMALMTACKKDGPESGPAILKLSPDVTAVTFSADGKTLYDADGTIIDPTFSVTTENADGWDVEVYSSWCGVTADKAAGTFTLTAEPNESETVRPDDAVVKVSAGDAEPVIITVSQQTKTPQAVITVEPSVSAVTFSASGNTLYSGDEAISPIFKVTVQYADSWDVSVEPDWCSAVKDEAAGTFTLSAEPNESETASPADATVTVTAGDAEPVVITVSQKAVAYDIYVSGEISYELASTTAVYWKNGQMFEIGERNDSFTKQIIEDNGDIYIAGGSGDNCVYWKNGEMTVLRTTDDKTGQIYDFTVVDGRFYAAGYVRMRATSWVDSEPVQLWSKISYAYGMDYYDGKLYAVGNVPSNYGAIWIDGELEEFGDKETTLYDICVVDGVEYIAGTRNGEVTYWVGRDEEHSTGSGGNVNRIKVHDGSVYMVGSKGGSAGYWCNGEFVALDSYEADAADMIFVGDDIYVVGTDKDYQTLADRAVYWKNGEKIIVSEQETSGSGILLMPVND